jgi:hypothetical protein
LDAWAGPNHGVLLCAGTHLSIIAPSLRVQPFDMLRPRFPSLAACACFLFFFWLRALGSARHYGWLVIFRSRRELTTTSEGIERGLSSAAETHTRDRGFNFISSSQITSRRPTDVYPVAIWQYVLKPTIRPSLAVAERFSSIWRRAERHTRTNQTTPSGDVSSSLGSDGRKRRGRGRGSELVGATDDAKPGAAS